MDASRRNGYSPTWDMPFSSVQNRSLPFVTTMRRNASPVRSRGRHSRSLCTGSFIPYADWMYILPKPVLTTKSISCCRSSRPPSTTCSISTTPTSTLYPRLTSSQKITFSIRCVASCSRNPSCALRIPTSSA